MDVRMAGDTTQLRMDRGWYISALTYTLTSRACNLALALRLWQDRQSLSVSAFGGAAFVVLAAFVLAAFGAAALVGAACAIATANSSIAAIAHVVRPRPVTIRPG